MTEPHWDDAVTQRFSDVFEEVIWNINELEPIDDYSESDWETWIDLKVEQVSLMRLLSKEMRKDERQRLIEQILSSVRRQAMIRRLYE